MAAPAYGVRSALTLRRGGAPPHGSTGAAFFPGQLGDFWLVNLVWFMVKCFILMFFAISLLRSVTGRLRIDQAMMFYFKIPAVLAFISLVLVIVV